MEVDVTTTCPGCRHPFPGRHNVLPTHPKCVCSGMVLEHAMELERTGKFKARDARVAGWECPVCSCSFPTILAQIPNHPIPDNPGVRCPAIGYSYKEAWERETHGTWPDPDAPKEKHDHPDHYGGKDNPYEAIKVIEAWGLHKDFCLGNVLKYIARAGKKPGEEFIEDLKKVAWYVNRRIEEVVKE